MGSSSSSSNTASQRRPSSRTVAETGTFRDDIRQFISTKLTKREKKEEKRHRSADDLVCVEFNPLFIARLSLM